MYEVYAEHRRGIFGGFSVIDIRLRAQTDESGIF